MPSVIVVAVTPGPGTGVGPLGVGDGVGVWLAGATDGVPPDSPAGLAQAETSSARASGTSVKKSCANLTTYESYAWSGSWFNR